jgi:KamA family protein
MTNLNQHKYFTSLDKVPQISEEERALLEPVQEEFYFRTNTYYNSLINWDEPDDPLRKMVIPSVQEHDDGGLLDEYDEQTTVVIQGLQRKYYNQCSLLIASVCGATCRYCYRKRIFMEGANDEIAVDMEKIVAYLQQNPEVTCLVITGGDPLVLSAAKLKKFLQPLREVETIRHIRVSSKMVAFNPHKIIEDTEMLEVLESLRTPDKNVWVSAHITHPREITDVAVRAINLIHDRGISMMNNFPIVKGINDDPQVIAEIYNRMVELGIFNYYTYICSPTKGNVSCVIPVEKALEIQEQAKRLASGFSRTGRLIMCTNTANIEVLGKSDGRIYFQFFHAREPQYDNVIFSLQSNPEACWFEDYEEVKKGECQLPLGQQV